ncbi:serine/threonine protein phosphatase [Brevibacillus reuszeri]|uniref:metallophosphoesterase n=1 Tax=Brevibacillus reuszeri TaxID=54915 RepID=UPI001B162F7B|nr:metallophosphoesterase [Brevibacillus reuszeri]GIO04530.1 serine/threonine protein phosphatase [Brevibacillus reuszeri]
MNLFVVGDVHACLHTFQELLNRYWNPETEVLIQLGDLVDRGSDTPGSLQFAKKLWQQYSPHVVFLKGNHEYEFNQHIENGPNQYWLPQCGYETLAQLQDAKMDVQEVAAWIKSLPLIWENEHILISHAGISAQTDDPLCEDNPLGVLWNRTPLANIQKLQVIGHTPCKSGHPEYSEVSHSWNIDTAAYQNIALSALRLSTTGHVLEIVQQTVDARDIHKQIQKNPD